jgi:hypothetical protein
MKFYIYDYSYANSFLKILDNKLTAIYSSFNSVEFYKNGSYHNTKNNAYIKFDRYKEFYLNGKFYGNQNDFTKQSWRKFVKMQVFL